MLKKLTFRTKVFLSFLSMLLLVFFIVAVSHVSFRRVIRQVDASNEINRMLGDVLVMKQYEADFILRNDEAAIANVDAAAAGMTEKIEIYLKELRNTSMQAAKDNLAAYIHEFQEYVAMKKARNDLEINMDKSGKAAFFEVQSIHEEMQSRLVDLIQRSDRFVASRLEQLYDANQLLLRLSNARLLRLSLLRKKRIYVLNRWAEENRRIGTLLEQMASNATNAENAERLATSQALFRDYSALFLRYLDDRNAVDRKDIMRMSKAVTASMKAVMSDQLAQVEAALEERSAAVVKSLGNARAANEMIALLMAARQHEKDYIIQPDPAHGEGISESIRKISDLASGMADLSQRSNANSRADAVLEILAGYQSDFDEYARLVAKQSRKEAEMAETAEKLNTIFIQARDAVNSEMKAKIGGAENLIYMAAVVAAVFGFGFAFFFARGITGRLSTTISTLRNSSAQLADASQQINSSSQALAQGTSEQAATVEETSASMEEIAAMMSKSGKNIKQIDTVMKDTLNSVHKAEDNLQQLTAAMEGVHGASQEISKINQSIDEIAFQTNLLSLNAAVEAARAGESGAGFAVVADEVRNLAIRSADSAKNATEMIKKTTSKIAMGKTFVEHTNKVFAEVCRAIEETSRLMDEIVSAADEQTRAVDQVNNATSELDRTIQENAAYAEETAAAFSELNQQSEYLKMVVVDLAGLIQGENGSAHRSLGQIFLKKSTDKEDGRTAYISSSGPNLLPDSDARG